MQPVAGGSAGGSEEGSSGSGGSHDSSISSSNSSTSIMSSSESSPIEVATNENLEVPLPKQQEQDTFRKYHGHFLADALVRFKSKQLQSLRKQRHRQIFSPNVSDGWLFTVCTLRARALSSMAVPYVIGLLHAVAATAVEQLLPPAPGSPSKELEMGDLFFIGTFVLTTLALLSFRLYTTAQQFHCARLKWGEMLEHGGNFVNILVAHGDHNIPERDHAARWVGALCIFAAGQVYGDKELPIDNFSGLLGLNEIMEAGSKIHSPLYCASQVRRHLNVLLDVHVDTPFQMAMNRMRQLDLLDTHLSGMVNSYSTLIHMKYTPFPVAGASHSRTLVMISILALPYSFGMAWGYRTIPIVAILSFAWLAMEAAATEMELSFDQDCVLEFLEMLREQIVTNADFHLGYNHSKTKYHYAS